LPAPTPLPGSHAYDAASRLTTLTYDHNGALLGHGGNTYTWEARGQLASITGSTPATFQYDAFGRLVRRTARGVTTDFLHDGMNTVQERVGANTTNLLTSLWVDEYLARTDATGTRGVLADALGSTVALVDAASPVQPQYTYEPFGTITTSQTGNGFQ
jgi:YD repeat-containing protein